MTATIRAIFFDLDGTLRIPTPGPTDAFIQFARSLDITISPQAEHRVKLWAHSYWGRDQTVRQDMNRFSTDEFWVNYSRRLLETVEARENLLHHAHLVRDFFGQQYAPHVARAHGSRELLLRLKAHGYILGLISNRSHPYDEEVTALGLDNLFDMSLAAGEISCWKPDPRIFQHALAQFGHLQPAECVYVGDNYYADGHGAAAAGLIPVLFDPENLYVLAKYHRIQQMKELAHTLRLDDQPYPV